MRIHLDVAWEEEHITWWLNALVSHNVRVLRQRPDLPLLYASGVRYCLEREETWSGVIPTITKGWEDCDSLAAWRAAEIIARGHRALDLTDLGQPQASRAGMDSIPAAVFLRTKTPRGVPGPYHCLVRYWIDGVAFVDDPSARLGMYDHDGRYCDRPE